jgi:hypothetical protein
VTCLPLASAATVLALLVGGGCRAPEPVAATQARSRKALLEDELIHLGRILEAARRGELLSERQIAIGVSESLVERLLAASLPSTRIPAGPLKIELEKVQPVFRGGLAAIVFRGSVSSASMPDARVMLELAGRLKDVHLENGRLTARVALVHFTVLNSFAGALGKNLVEDALRANLAKIEALVPPLEIPVLLEQGVDFAGIDQGPIRVGAGRLPLEFTLTNVVPVNTRLWLLVRAAAGEWEARPAERAGSGP